jgi:hypothetical protein
VSGHVANAGGQAVTLEIDKNGDGTVDATVTSNAETGNFSYSPNGLANGMVTIRARVQAASGQPTKPWSTLNFVLHTDPDGTEAQTLVSAYSGFNTLWQNARTNYTTAIVNADLLFRSQTQTSQEAYDSSLGAASAQRKSQIESAQSAYRTILAGAEQTRSSALAAAATQFATDLANFAGDTTSYVLKPFAWPDAPPDFAHQIPDDKDQPRPPAEKPLYEGSPFSPGSDAQYQAAVAAAENTYNQTVRQAEEDYRQAEQTIQTAYREAETAAHQEYWNKLIQFSNERNVDLAAGTNPTDLVAVTNTIRTQQAELTGKYLRDVGRSQADYDAAVAASFAAMLAAAANVGPVEAANLGYAHMVAVAGYALTRSTTQVGLLETYQLAYGVLTRQLAEATADHAHWEKVRQINADLAYEQKVAVQREILEVALAAARQTRSKDLATAARNREVTVQTAEVTRWQAKAAAQVPAVEVWDAFENTPWSEYQKKQIQHSAAYATTMAPKIITQVTSDADAAKTEAHSVADARKSLADGAAALKRARRQSDNLSWRDFRLAANDEVKSEAYSRALRWQQHDAALRSAEADFGMSQAAEQYLYDLEAADINRDETIFMYTNPCPTCTPEELMHLYDAFWIREAENKHALDTAIIAAKEVRDLGLSDAEKTFAVNSNTDERGREERLTDAYKAYQIAVAQHAETYARGYADKYAIYVKAVSAAEATATKAFAASEKTLSDEDAGAQNTWNTDDTTALQDFYLGAAQIYAGALEAWNTAVDSPWTKFLAGLGGVEVDRVTLLGSKLVDHATNAGTELVNWLTGLSANSKTLADKTADGLDEQTQDLADALKEYAEKVAEARRIYAVTLAEKTALHDRAVTAANETYKNNQAERERVRENAKDAAEWTYERLVADAWRDEVVIDDNHQNFWPRVTATEGSAGNTRDRAIAQISRDYAVGMATDQKDWVAAVGTIHVTLAADAKAAADTLAGSLKTASDGLTSDQADAAKELASDLATAEADYTSDNATLQASHDDAAAGPDGQLQIGLTDVANLQREGQTRERGEYETDSYGRHSAALVATGSTSLIATGGTLSGPLADLLGYQQQVAASDLAWSTGKETAQNNFESLLSDAYYAHATAEHGPLGSVKAHIHATGEAIKNQNIGLANSDKQLSIDSTDNLADFTEDAQSAASKAARDGVAAETEYDVNRAEAKRVYHNAIAAAELARTTATQDANLAFFLAQPYPVPPNWANSSEYQTLLATLTTALHTATAAYDAAVKQAKIDHANEVGGKQILRATKLGTAKVDEATEKKAAEVAYWSGQKVDENTFETAVTDTSMPGIQGEAAAERDYNIVAGGNQRTAMSAFQAAFVQLLQDMKPVNVARAAGIAAAEGDYHAATSSRTALQWTNLAAGFPTISRERFLAAQAGAEAQWISDIRPSVVAFVTATTGAEADEAILLMQATATAENARAEADEAYVAAVEPLNYQRTVDSGAQWREHAENERDRIGTLNVTNAGHRGTQAIDYATAAKTRWIAYANADKTLHVSLLERGPLVVIPPELPPLIDPLEQDKRVAYANADLAEMEDRGDADVTYIAGIVEGDTVYRDGRSTGYKLLETELATIERDHLVARSGHDQTHALAWLAAQTTQWSAEVSAASGLRTAHANALANLRTADYGHFASALVTIDTAMNLPWTQYIADKAAALSAWWVSTEKANFLALAANLNGAETTYQTTVNTAYGAWITTTASAEAALVQAFAQRERTERIANATAEELYEQALADADSAWQNARVLNLKNHRNEFWADRRAAIAENDTTWARIWEAEAMLGHPGDAEADRAFVVSEPATSGTRIVSRKTNHRDRIVGEDAAYVPYIETAADADRDYAKAENLAATARISAILNATADHDMLSAQSLSDAIDALALASQTPWATYDAAVADLNETYIETIAPAACDLSTNLANADKAYTDSQADAVYTLSHDLAQDGATYRASMANAKLAQAQTSAQARTAAAQFMPIAQYNALAPNVGATATTGAPATQGTETPSDPDASCGCPLAPRDPNGLPTLQQASSVDVQGLAISHANPLGYDPAFGIDMRLPADARRVNHDEIATSTSPFSREHLTRPRRDDSTPPQVIDKTAPKGLPFTVHTTTAELAMSPFTAGTVVITGSAPPPPLPDNVKVEVNMTEKDIEAAARTIVLGTGPNGALTAAQQLEVQRWISVIKAHIARQYSLMMNKGPARDILIKELESIIRGPGGSFQEQFGFPSDPAKWRQIRNLSFASYEELKAMLATHRPGINVDAWISERIQEEWAHQVKLRLARLGIANDEQKLIIDLIQFVLDIGGIFEPTPFCDIASTTISISRVELADAGINIVSIIPGAGDALKLLKVGKWIALLGAVAMEVLKHPELARAAEPLLRQANEILQSTARIDLDSLPKEWVQAIAELREKAWLALKNAKEALAKVGTDATTGIVRGTNPSRVIFNGFEVRAVRSLSHVDVSTLRAMAKKGFAAKDINGVPLDLHHLGQNPMGPLVEIPVTRHSIANRIQHPLGNAPGAGLTDEQRAAHDLWREAYWKARALEELARRGVTP